MEEWMFISLLCCAAGMLGVCVLIKQMKTRDKGLLLVTATVLPLLFLGSFGIILFAAEGDFLDWRCEVGLILLVLTCVYAMVVLHITNNAHDIITVGIIEKIITMPSVMSKNGYICSFVVRYYVNGKEYVEGSSNTIEGSDFKEGQSVKIKYSSHVPKSFHVIEE